MKTIKPNRLSVLTRNFEVKRTYYFGVSTFLFFDLRTGQILPEAAMWQFAAEELGKDASLDVGIPKTNSEYLIKGSVFTPGGNPQETCPVTARVGNLEKTLYVIGDRFWKGRDQTKPQPFTQMPLTWELTFGGEGFNKNPLGKGLAPVETEHGPVHFLPNIEAPGKMVTKPQQQSAPVGFGPIDQMWPQRYLKVGTYDLAWLKTDFPGFARDMDWSFHNLAPADQQQKDFFTGIEPFRFTNMHPTEPEIVGKLPGYRARTFLTQRVGNTNKFLELDVNLTTFWVFPHVLRGILIFQGSTKASEDDGSDVEHLLIAAESLGQDKGIAHYQDVLEKRIDKDLGPLYVLRDEDLLPPGASEGESPDPIEEMIALCSPEGLQRKNIERGIKRRFEEIREYIASHGLDPDEHGPPAPESIPALEVPTDPVEFQKFVEKMKKEGEEQRKRAEKIGEEVFEEQKPNMLAAGIDPQMIRDEIDEPQTGPPRFTAEGEITRIRELRDTCRALGTPVDELEDWATNEEVHQNWRDGEAQIREAYRLSAHLQSPVTPLSELESERARNELLDRYIKKGSFKHYDLSGADLSRLDLRGADFREGWLESVDFSGSNLTDTDFTGAVLARANLTDATLYNTNFQDANLGSACLKNTKGKDNNFAGAILNNADMTEADFSGAILDQIFFYETTFTKTNFSQSSGERVTFIKCNIENINFSNSKFSQTSFIECKLNNSDFYGSTLKFITMVSCDGRSLNFCESHIEGLSIVQSGSFAGCDFKNSKAKTLQFRGVDLRESDFSAATIKGLDLSEANLENAKFYRTKTRDSLFVKTNFQNADMTSADLLKADLQKADIRGTNFLGANLYGANFGRVLSDDKTNLKDANQLKVTIYPLRHQ